MPIIEKNDSFTINDMNFTVGASAIDIQQENLSYKFQTLRQSTSSKIPTGNGGTILNVVIAIPKEDVLKLHRLVIELRRNPYCFIENKFVRHKLVPHWDISQNMAFTLLTSTIESVIGNVGLFNLNLQFQWFNYFPMTSNFLFREEWETQWLRVSNIADYQEYLSYLGYENVQFIKKSINNFITDVRTDVTPPNGFKTTFEDNFKSFSGFIFDLLPLPSGMEKAFAVQSPKQSLIYVRFYNELQRQALLDGFGIDVRARMGNSQYYILCDSGEYSIDEALKIMNIDFIDEMLSYDYFDLYFKIYKFVTIPETLKAGLTEQLNKLIEELPKQEIDVDNDPFLSLSQVVKDNVKQWEQLANAYQPFVIQLNSVLEKMIAGDNLTGKKYIDHDQLLVNSVNTGKHADTSLHYVTDSNDQPMSMAVDINLYNGSAIGSKLGNLRVQESSFADSIRAYEFGLDLGYVINNFYSDNMRWGGNIIEGDSKSSLIRANVEFLFNIDSPNIPLKRIENGLSPIPSNWVNIVYQNKAKGDDPVHVSWRNSAGESESDTRRWADSNKASLTNKNNSKQYTATDGVQAWYKVSELIGKKDLTENDIKFFEECKALINEGWSYYSKDRSVNGIFEKTIKISLPTTSGKQLFNDQGFMGFADGSNSDLDTVYTKFSATIKHIVASIPIIGQEFPSQQHLASIEPNYMFEFLTTDKLGNHDGLGKTVQLFESARIGLQANARNIKDIYDCWMADIDTFITRFLGTYSPSNQNLQALPQSAKKVIISGSNVSTVRSQPGLSSYSLAVEESQPFVGETFVKTNTASTKNYNEIYKKMITKILSISKITNKSKSIQNYLDLLNSKLDPSIPDWIEKLLNPSTITTTFVQKFIEKTGSANLHYLQLDSTKTGELTTNQSNQLEYLIQLVGLQNVLAQIILFEKTHGGIDVGDLYGLETICEPQAYAFMDSDIDGWGATSVMALYYAATKKGYDVVSIGNYIPAYLLAVVEGSLSFVSNASYPSYAQPGDYLKTRSILGPTQTNPVYIDVLRRAVAIEQNSVETPIKQNESYALETFFTAPDNISLAGSTALNVLSTTQTNKEALTKNIDEYIIDPLFTELILINYLRDIALKTGAISFCFTAGTSDAAASIINDFFDFDKTPIKSEVAYGLSTAIGKYLTNLINDGKKPATQILTKEEYERNKLALVKTELESILRANLNDPFILDFFGIKEDVNSLNNVITIDSKDALPDLNLPAHPYYEKTYLTPPDFYYYNYHEDGQYSDYEYLTRIADSQITQNVNATYDFLDSLSKGENPNTNSTDISAGEVYSSFDGAENIADPTLEEELKKAIDLKTNPGAKSLKPTGYTNPNNVTGTPDTLQFNQGINTCSWLPNNFDRESTFTPVADKALIDKIKGIEASFGVKEGYANERNEIQKLIPDRKVALSSDEQLPDSMTHFFGKEDIQDLTRECTKDIVSQKFTMKRAWPTFKIYMIEEDQTEDFLCNYDDFYNYNAIKEITIVRSREVAGDTAIITLQNLSGILDGSKRLVIKDTDFLYENRAPDGSFTNKGNKIEKSRLPENQDTNAEELVGSIVLRPGSNMQIRLGYGNNANTLEVKMSGRIVDINMSENSDLIDITVQSFGVELEQQQKGLDTQPTETFNLTHKLLGSLMFSNELKHFGRFENSNVLQFGENKDSKLDFKKYDTNKWWQKITGIYFRNTSQTVSKLYDEQFSLTGFTSSSINNALVPLTLGLSKVPGQITTRVELATSLAWDGVLAAVGLVKSTLKLFENSLDEKLSYAFTSPQDDNLFPPHPKDYLMRPGWIWATTKESIKSTYRTGDLTLGAKKAIRTFIAGATSPKMDLSDLDYTIKGSTIFQIFHEMTLRHPGYAYMPLPYGRDYRYTMFFGVPSQRYWSKPAHPIFTERVNEIRKSISSPLNDSIVDSGKRPGLNRSFFKSHTYSELKTNLSNWWAGDKAWEIKQTQEENEKLANSLGDKDLFLKLNIYSLQEALLEYYSALTLRFEPFRRYHMVTSDTDIISNNISVSEYNFANAVAVKYYEPVSHEQEDIQLVKIHEFMDDSEIRLKQIDYSSCNGKQMALRYGVGELIYQVKKMYGGSILIWGNSRIKPWDICYIIDSYNDISGVIEVEQIVERISFESGYTCDIRPNAVVFANEISSMPILEGLKTLVGNVYHEQTKFNSNFKGNSFFNYLTTNKATSVGVDALDWLYDGSVLNGNSLQDISTYTQYSINDITGIPADTNSQNFLQSSFMSGAWLLGSLFYLNKLSAGQSVVVYPLFKNGLPYTAGIPKARPEAIWTIFRGQVSAFINDLTKGTSSYIDYWKLLGTESLKAYQYDSVLNKEKSEAAGRVN